MALRGAVFDFDGVLARTMENHAAAYRQVLAPFGLSFPDREIFLREGARSETIIQDLLEGAGHTVTGAQVKDLSRHKQAAFAALPAELYPGVDDLVRGVRARARRVGLVTGTRRENLQRLIPHLLPLLDAVLAQESYTRDKPHPEPYLKTAAAMGLEPRECLALENAVRGVQSAVAAGYGRVVAITTTMGPDELRRAGADDVVTDHGAALDAMLAALA